MSKKIFLMGLLMALVMVWSAGCVCTPQPVVAAPAPVVVEPAPPPPAPEPQVVKPTPVEEPAPSKKLKKRVIKDTD
jgi:hypothetical protein